MTKCIKFTIIVSVLVTAVVCLYLKGDQPETKFPQLSSTVNYADIKQRIEVLDKKIKKEDHFNNFLNPQGLETVWHVPRYENSLVFYYVKNEDNNFRLGTTITRKRSPSRSISVDIGYNKNGVATYYKEFSHEFLVRIFYHESQKLSRVVFEDDWGKREIKFDEKEQIVSDDYNRFPEDRIQKRLIINKEIESEIRESIAAGYTDIQKQEPKEWHFQLPKGLNEGEVKNRLTKVGEYHQAIVDGKADPLADYKPFTEIKDDRYRPSAHIFYSGKKNCLCGRYSIIGKLE